METLTGIATWCLDSPVLLACILLSAGLVFGGRPDVPSDPGTGEAAVPAGSDVPATADPSDETGQPCRY